MEGMRVNSHQCRAARALLGWSQQDLEGKARIAKKTIADFERGSTQPLERSIIAMKTAFESHGVIFLGQGEQGEGVRFRVAMPKLVVRHDLYDTMSISFSFDYKGKRQPAFIAYDALARIAVEPSHPLMAFDRNCGRILMYAAGLLDEKAPVDELGALQIQPGDILPVEYDSDEYRRENS
jgi:DNA-binding XRE family transcriptional regulator